MRPIPAIYSLGNAPEWLAVAEKLKSELGWEPVYWLTVDLIHEKVAKRFPNATLHNLSDLNRCIPTPQNELLSAWFLDEEELSTYVLTEQKVIELMDRMSLNNSFSHRERQNVYLWLLSFWLHTIARYKPKLVVFNAPPHSPAELILHDICQSKGIKVRIYTPTQLLALHLITDHYEAPAKMLNHFLNKRLQNNDPTISPKMQEALSPIVHLDGTKPWYLEAVGHQEKRKEGLKTVIEGLLKKDPDFNIDLVMEPGPGEGNTLITHKGKINAERRKRRTERIRRVFKQPGKPIEAPIMTRGSYADYQIWAYVQKVRLEHSYDTYAKQVDTKEKYIFFAMHYQPERTSCPDGGRFNNQLLVASLITNLLPNNWLLVVKEHPSQFSFGGEGEMSREPSDYQRFASLPRTVLAPRSHATADLVNKAQAVVTLTGFIGIEALLRSLPTIIFGAAWYQECPGVMHVKSKNELRTAINSIAAGTKPKMQEVLMFLGALEDAGKSCYSNTSFSDAINISSDQLVERLYSLMIEFESHPET